jgi:hypothetical protein
MKKFLIVLAVVFVLYVLYKRMYPSVDPQQSVQQPGELEPQIVVSPASESPKFINMQDLIFVAPVEVAQAENYATPAPNNLLQGPITV